MGAAGRWGQDKEGVAPGEMWRAVQAFLVGPV